MPARDVLDSISQDLHWAKEKGYDAYGVLNACRALVYLEDGSFVSKAEAARWAGERLPHADRDLVARALAVHESRSDAIDDDTRVWAFVDGVRSQVDAAV